MARLTMTYSRDGVVIALNKRALNDISSQTRLERCYINPALHKRQDDR